MKEFDTHQTIKKSKTESKEKLLHIIFFLILFSICILRNEEHLKLYIGLSILVCIFAFFRGLCKPSRISNAIANGFTFWIIILFSIYFFYGIALTKYDYFNAKYFFFMFVIILVTELLFIDVPAKNTIEIFIRVCAITSVAVSVYILINEWTLIIYGGTRIGESGSGNVNTVAIYLGTMSLPCVYKIICEKKYNYFISYCLSTITMLLTGSKMALLFILLGILILSILKNRIKLHKYILPLLATILLWFLIFNVEYLYNIIGFRVIDFIGSLGFDIEGASYSYSTTSRLQMYKLAYEAFLKKPIFGGGWFYFSVYSGLGTYTHSNVMELLVTYGIIGFIVYYSMFFVVLLKLKKYIKQDGYAKLLFAMIIIILINDFAAVSFSYNILNYQILLFGYLYARGMKE